MGYCKVGTVEDLAPGRLQVRIGNSVITIFRSDQGDDNYCAINDRCPHRGASLIDGFLDSGKIFCPWHDYDFDLRTGASSIAPDLSVQTYPIRIDSNGVVWILNPGELIDSKEETDEQVGL
ncbi:MAG: Rieske (2Fe-2S) protein [Acidobacteria bacterium]|nr:Rieske (2Fe-2S) protein [Acidobacteriota bacterium]